MERVQDSSGNRRRGLSIAARLALSLSAVFILALLSEKAADIWGVPFVEGHGLRERKRLEALKIVGICADTLQDRFAQWSHERNEDLVQSCITHPEPERLERLAEIGRETAGDQLTGARLLDRLRADPEYARAGAWLQALQEGRPDFTRIRVIDARSGLVLAGLPEEEVGRRTPLAAEATALPAEAATLEERDGQVLFWVRCALKEKAGRPLLLLEAGADLDKQFASLGIVGTYLGAQGGALIVDDAGNLITNRPGSLKSAPSLVQSAARRAAMLAGNGERGILEASSPASTLIVAYRPVAVSPRLTWGVAAWQDLGGIGWYLRDEARISFLPVALGAAAVLLVVFFLLRHIIRPVQQLSEAAARVAGGDLTARATVTSANEIGLLARTFNTMVERLQESRQALEHQVEERTAEIAARNRQLREQIELRQAGEERLRLFAAAIEDATEGIYVVDLEGRILYCNPAAAGQMGHVPAEVVGRSIRDLHRDPAQRGTDLIPAIRRTGRWAGEIAGASSDGRSVELWLAASLVRDPSGNPIAIVGLTRDLADQKKLEAEHVRTQKLESVGVLAGGLAHDFNNLLTIILGNLDLARLFAGANPDVAEALDHASEAAVRAGDLTRQLITFSKGGHPVKRVGSIARMLRETVIFAAAGSNVACDLVIPDELPVVEFDEGQMRQVVHNLVQNAREAMPAGGILRIGACATRLESGDIPSLPAGSYLCIEFADQGTGIPREHLSRIFDPYFSTKDMDAVKGRGLGLAVAYSIVRSHGGAIVADSLVGEGTKISIYLPESPQEAEEDDDEAGDESGAQTAPADVTVQEPDAAAEGPVRGRVLVMDDEPLVLGMAGSALRRLGYAATLCRSGAEAVVQYEIGLDSGRRFDAVILDLTVPGGLGGPETLGRLRQIDPHVRAALSSGYTDHPAVIDWKQEGFAAFIAKPYSLKAFQELLESLA